MQWLQPWGTRSVSRWKNSLYWKENSVSTDLIPNNNQNQLQIDFILLSHFLSISHVKSTVQRHKVSTANSQLQHLERLELYQSLPTKFIAWLLDFVFNGKGVWVEENDNIPFRARVVPGGRYPRATSQDTTAGSNQDWNFSQLVAVFLTIWK